MCIWNEDQTTAFVSLVCFWGVWKPEAWLGEVKKFWTSFQTKQLCITLLFSLYVLVSLACWSIGHWLEPHSRQLFLSLVWAPSWPSIKWTPGKFLGSKGKQHGTDYSKLVCNKALITPWGTSHYLMHAIVSTMYFFIIVCTFADAYECKSTKYKHTYNLITRAPI